MVKSSDAERARASREATDWLILLQDSPEDADLLRRFGAWKAASSSHAEAWAVTQHAAGVIASAQPAYAQAWRENPRPSYLRSHAKRLGWAGAAAFAVFVLALSVPDALLRLRADYVTGTAEIRSVELDDGSQVVLAPHSAVAVTYTPNERRVNLLSGEAYFTVTHSAQRPFRVAAGDMEATDLGTEFEIRRNARKASVAVREGIVHVAYRGQGKPVSETLHAGQAIDVDWDRGAARRAEAPGLIAPWRNHQIVALDRPMGEIIDELRPYFRGTILVMDDSLTKRPVTGVYNLSDTAEALRGVVKVHGAVVRHVTPWLLVVSSA